MANLCSRGVHLCKCCAPRVWPTSEKEVVDGRDENF